MKNKMTIDISKLKQEILDERKNIQDNAFDEMVKACGSETALAETLDGFPLGWAIQAWIETKRDNGGKMPYFKDGLIYS